MLVAFLLTRRAASPLFILLAVGGEKTTYFVTTLIVRRPRPDVPTIGARHVTSSFPSGHVGSSVSLYGSIAILVLMHSRHRSVGARAVAVGLVAIIATVVAYCRMYRGFHFLTDVVVGSLIGAVWLPIALRLVALLPDKRHGAGEVSRTRHQRRRADASRSAV